MNHFESKLVSIRSLFKNEYDDQDRGRNYYIPLYQRTYTWSVDEVSKLILDISEIVAYKEGTSFHPYFIGGIVLSRESISGAERTKQSLEVIDGQQRLTTLSLLLAMLVQEIKFKERDFGAKQQFAEHLGDEIASLLLSSTLDPEDYTIIEMLKVERSDDLSILYKDIITQLSDSYINTNSFNQYAFTDEAKNLVLILNKINELFSDFENDFLINFCLQLLDHTQAVVTKTKNTDTGFLVFEKLNDSGVALEPQDLLKNYLFRTGDKVEYEILTTEWKNFLDEVKSINTTKSKILPREFLEQYLLAEGKSFSKTKNQIFNVFKDIRKDDYGGSLDLLDDLKKTAIEYKSLKRDAIISHYLNSMNFKIGYIVFLSFYKKFDYSAYKESRINILKVIFRLGLVYLITGNSKLLSEIVPTLCKMIIDSQVNCFDTVTEINIHVDKLVKKIEIEFTDILENTNMYRKRVLVTLLLRVINYHLEGSTLNSNATLEHIMPQNFDLSECTFENINEDNIKSYSNRIGNLTLLPQAINSSCSNQCFPEKIKCLMENNPAYITRTVVNQPEITSNTKFDAYKKVYAYDISASSSWGKETIIARSTALSNIAFYILIEDKLDIDFFQL